MRLAILALLLVFVSTVGVDLGRHIVGSYEKKPSLFELDVRHELLDMDAKVWVRHRLARGVRKLELGCKGGIGAARQAVTLKGYIAPMRVAVLPANNPALRHRADCRVQRVDGERYEDAS